jgi:N-acetylglucosamine-6-sulfatase
MQRHSTGFPRRLLLLFFGATGVTGALAVGSGTPPATLDQAAAGQVPPNILVIETDDQTLESMRVMDNVNSRIGGSRGVTFRNSFVNYSLCCPSRATFLTGQYMHNHRVLGNEPPSGGFDRFHALHGDNNLAVWLEDAGYYTGLIGKYLNGYSNEPPVPPGWSEWRAAPIGYGAYNYPLNENGTLVHYGTDPADFKQDVLTDKAIDFVDRRAPDAQPFFLWLNYAAPHWSPPEPNPNPPYDCQRAAKPAPRHANAFNSEPLPRPPSFNEADVSDKPIYIRNRPRLNASQIADIQRKYRCELESLLSVDEGVKEVVDALKANAELGKTVLMFTSDNGFFHGEHRIPTNKQHIYEESIRVPLLMRGPAAIIPRGVRVNDLVINADLAPTIVDLANANPGQVMDGRSLIPVVQQPGIDRGRQLLIEEPSFKAIRTERYIYSERRSGEKELYDLKNDPFELRNRSNYPSYASVQNKLAARLQELKHCAGSGCHLYSTP